jgi:hypothetical protein
MQPLDPLPQIYLNFSLYIPLRRKRGSAFLYTECTKSRYTVIFTVIIHYILYTYFWPALYYFSSVVDVPAPWPGGYTFTDYYGLQNLGRYSSVDIATRYGLDGPGIESRCGVRDFPHPYRPSLGAHPASYTMVTGSFLGVKRSGRGVNHPPTT